MVKIFEQGGDCSWVTINGNHICIGKGGDVEKGPKGLKGKNLTPMLHGVIPKPKDLKPGQTTKEASTDAKGNYEPERDAYHRRIVDQFTEGKLPPEGRQPIAVILGGGTASGKTTASREFIGQNPHSVRVDSDELKLKVPEYEQLKISDPDNAAFRAHKESADIGRLLLGNTVARGLDFTYDSTTSGSDDSEFIKTLGEHGYNVKLYFVDIPISEAIRRADLRSRTSNDPVNRGRKVPEDIIRGSHQRAAANFFQLKDFKEVSEVHLYDNSGEHPREIYSKVGGKENHVDLARYEDYNRKARGLHENLRPRFISERTRLRRLEKENCERESAPESEARPIGLRQVGDCVVVS